ncbi:uncharacterized protein LOC117222145 isoform X2 [Megalopta genalis]|uniref:uncharacterized protein LOC117222145 isoform X2 n=1 Tax=Megalopta genalis TaxID=115081 RepID=UPI003FD1E4B3
MSYILIPSTLFLYWKLQDTKIYQEVAIIMGNYINKYFFHNTETEKEETITQPTSTDEETVDDNVCTPVAQKTLSIDPRSVTSGIDRTPIEVYSTSERLYRRTLSAIPKHLQCKPYLETDIDTLLLLSPKKSAPKMDDANLQNLDDFKTSEMQLTPTINSSMKKTIFLPIEEERYSVLGIDPRSPAADFDRTPMLRPKSMELLLARHKEDKLRRGSYEADVLYPKFSYCETSSQFNIPEIQALPDLAACKIITSNLFINEVDSRLNDTDSSSYYSPKTETDYGETQTDSGREDENKITSDGCNDEDVKKNMQHKEITGSDTIKIWRDSLVLDNPTESDSTKTQDVHVDEKMSQLPKQEVIITFDDDSIAKDALSLKLSKCEINKKRIDVTRMKKKALKSEAKITTDEKKIFNYNDKNGSENTKTRTPLANRSNNGQQVIRNKIMKSRVSQENSSPHKYITKYKSRGIEWDPDSTVII